MWRLEAAFVYNQLPPNLPNKPDGPLGLFEARGTKVRQGVRSCCGAVLFRLPTSFWGARIFVKDQVSPKALRRLAVAVTLKH